MKIRNLIAIAPLAAIVAVLPAASSAQAVFTTFAQAEQPQGAGGNLYYRSEDLSFGPIRGGSLYSISLPSDTTPGPVGVDFRFDNGFTQRAVFNLNAAAPLSSPAQLRFRSFEQSGFSGSFSYISSEPVLFGGIFYDAGSNLLTGTFTNATFSFRDDEGVNQKFSSDPGSVSFVSDFVDFGDTNDAKFDFFTSLTLIRESDAIVFAGNFGRGFFRSSPAPTPFETVAAVPEPATWALLVTGFGMAGLGLRRAKKAPVAAR